MRWWGNWYGCAGNKPRGLRSGMWRMGGVQQCVGDLPDIAGAHGDQEVARLGDELEVFDDGVEGVQVQGMLVAFA